MAPVRRCVAVALAGAWCGALFAQAQAPLFRAGVDLVNVGVTVTDKRGALATDLAAGDFEIYEDGKPQAIRYFAAGERSETAPPMHLGLLLDVSGSMNEDIAFTKTASIRFLNTLTDAVDITVFDFDTEVRAARFRQEEFARAIERIRLQKTGGMTALYDAIGMYLHDAQDQDGRKIMLLYTDGWDTRSSLNYTELVDLLKASDVTLYPIGALDRQSGSAQMEQRLLLQRLAETTGGQAYFPASVRDLNIVYEKVVAEIRAQYTLGYVSTNPRADGAWRKVEVRVVRKDAKELRTRARRGYFAAFKRPAP